MHALQLQKIAPTRASNLNRRAFEPARSVLLYPSRMGDIKVVSLCPSCNQNQMQRELHHLNLSPSDELLVVVNDEDTVDREALLTWLGVMFDLLATISPTLPATPLFQSVGWTPDLAEELAKRKSAHPGAHGLVPSAGDGRFSIEPTMSRTAERDVLQSHRHAQIFNKVALGGTFDRLHAGHRLLLAAAGYVAALSVYVGVTADELLASKKNRHLIQSYSERQAVALDFLRMVNPYIAIHSSALRDPKEPTAAELDPSMEAIVVSKETVAGAEQINASRRARGFEPLEIVVVGLVGEGQGSDKLSSTELRAHDAGSESNDQLEQPVK